MNQRSFLLSSYISCFCRGEVKRGLQSLLFTEALSRAYDAYFVEIRFIGLSPFMNDKVLGEREVLCLVYERISSGYILGTLFIWIGQTF